MVLVQMLHVLVKHMYLVHYLVNCITSLVLYEDFVINSCSLIYKLDSKYIRGSTSIQAYSY